MLLALLALVPVFDAADAPAVGDPAPAFTATADDGSAWDSADHFGHGWTVVYFYPADMTGGCTKQACSFRDDSTALQEAGITVVGISGDSAANHALFKRAHDLNFTLLADPGGEIADKFGVPNKKGVASIMRQIDGVDHELVRTATIKRWTFLIDPDGEIADIDRNVKPADDSQSVLEKIAAMEPAAAN